MSVAKFKLKDFRKVLDAIAESNEFIPSHDDGYNAEIFIGKKIIDRNGNELGSPKFTAPDLSKIDKSLVEKKVMLVKDHGLYLMSNISGKPSPLAYAAGCNPDTDEDYYENSRQIAGGDDFCEYLPLDLFKHTIACNQHIININITSECIEIS